MNKQFIQMKTKLLTLLGAALIIAACNNKPKEQNEGKGDLTKSVSAPDHTGGSEQSAEAGVENAPIINFKEDTYNFSKIKQGEKVAHVFEFTNTGKSPLIISDVQAGCGCTTPKFSKKPIQPGGAGSIEVGYNSSGQRGSQHKIITVYSNAEPKQMMLHLKGEVQE